VLRRGIHPLKILYFEYTQGGECLLEAQRLGTWPQNRDYTEEQLLGFSYDFGITVIFIIKNADAMVLPSALMRGTHPPDIQNSVQGECLSQAHWLGPWRQHFDDESWCGSSYASLAESTFCVSLFCDSIATVTSIS
jgi:hypothetical protein